MIVQTFVRRYVVTNGFNQAHMLVYIEDWTIIIYSKPWTFLMMNIKK